MSIDRFVIAGVSSWIWLAGVGFTGAQEILDYKELENRLQRDGSELPTEPLMNSYADMLKQVTPAVVTISAKRDQSSQMEDLMDDPRFKRLFPDGVPPDWFPGLPNRPMPVTGSGVIVTPDGYILTNNHVVEESKELEVTLPASRKPFDARVVATDPKSDVALIKIEADVEVPHVTIGDSSKLRVGNLAFAIGNPFGLDQTVTMGIISALGRSSSEVSIVDYADFIQTDAAINRGNSGGALVDAKGRLIGINTAIQGGVGGGNVGIGFAIPANMALDIVERLLDGGGVVRRGFLGVSLQPMDRDLAEALGWKEDFGVLIADVFSGTPAAEAGLRPQDIITSFQGVRAEALDRLRLRISNTPPDEKVTFGIFRNGKEIEVDLALAELPSDPRTVMSRGRPEPEPAREFLEGVEIVNLTNELREEFEIDPDETGVLVRKVDPDSAAAEAGLSAGQVILEVNEESVSNVREALSVRQAFDKDVLLLRISDKGARSLLGVRLRR